MNHRQIADETLFKCCLNIAQTQMTEPLHQSVLNRQLITTI